MTAPSHPCPSLPVDRPEHRARSVQLRTLVAALVALLALDNMLLLGFLGQPLALTLSCSVALPAILAALAYRAVPTQPGISGTALCICLATALVLLVLGGEGRLLYATDDWQIRDAVLADLGTQRWPFDYHLEGKSQILRAPLGMYLLPALVGGANQTVRNWALLAHNGLFLGLLFAIGGALFDSARARAATLVLFIAFSGLDVLGNGLKHVAAGHANWDHIERWANGFQYSSHITQLFWVPQHALAGWTCALFYLLWRRGLVPVGLFGATIPLVALWSPFAVLGALPFALFATVRALLTGTWDRRDLLLCGTATAIALPALLYLDTDAASVGGGLNPPPLPIYLLLMLFEVLPFILPLLMSRIRPADRPTLLIATACLFLMPLWRIGAFTDFQMRASIMPLAIVAIAFAQWGIRLRDPRHKAAFLLIVALGSVTGAAEVGRLFRLAPSPAPHCSLQGVWTQQSGLIVPYASYFAPRSALPPILFPAPPVDRAGTNDPAHCWDRPWRTPWGNR